MSSPLHLDVPPRPAPSATAHRALSAVYARAVRESGGLPDVKISVLERALAPVEAAGLAGVLRALWREGRVTLSLGDWSLADEETRRAAVELDGERYLLVRMEQDPAAEELSGSSAP